MGDGRVNRAIARTTEIKERVPELKARVPELKERMPELTARGADELKARGTELRSKGTELRSRGGELARQYAKLDVAWARCGYARALRETLLSFGLVPLMDLYVRRTTVGREVLDELEPPVVLVANHSSHMDTPTILRALPRKWRQRTAVAAAADYFYKKRAVANAVALLFNTVPLGRTGGGLGNGATDHVDRLIDQRWNLLMYPEGTRSRDGAIGKVRSGAAVLAAQHDIDIVPIYVSGTHDAMPPGQSWPRRRGPLRLRRHPVEVRFGAPIRAAAGEDRRAVMARVREFWDREGLPLEPVEQAAAGESDARAQVVEPNRSALAEPVVAVEPAGSAPADSVIGAEPLPVRERIRSAPAGSTRPLEPVDALPEHSPSAA